MYRTLFCFWILANLLVGSSRAQEQPAESARMVAMEIVIAEFVSNDKTADNGPSAAAADPTERLKQLEKQGQVGAVTRVQLTSLSGIPAMVQLGERVPIATGRVSFAGGNRNAPPGERGGTPFGTQYSFENLGSIVSVTPEVGADRSVVLKLEVERSRLASTPGETASDSGVRSRTISVTARSTIRVAPGQTILVSGARYSGGNEPGELIILATARVVE